MAGKKKKENMEPHIANRRALHDYFIISKIECGVVLVGSEVKSLRAGKAAMQDSWAAVENGELIMHGVHIDPYEKSAIVYNHVPKRDRKLLVHRREIKRLADETDQKATTLIPLAMYFKGGRVKVELGVAKGKQQHDKRATIKKKEMDRELRRVMTQRQ